MSRMEPGQRYGRLVATEDVGRDELSRAIWRFECDCGTEVVTFTNRVRTGRVSSCGCLLREYRNRPKGFMRRTPEYKAWDAMIQRCTNPACESYVRYGKRGIKVCDRWRSFDNFIEDVGRKPSPDLSLDRIDNDGDYEPSNVRWATRKQQANNTRRNKRMGGDNSIRL